MTEPVENRVTDHAMKERLIRTVRPFATVGQGTRDAVARTPTDLVGVAGFAVVAAVLLTAVEITSPVVRAAIGFPLLLLAPGYVTVSVLFPRETPYRRTEKTPLLGQTQSVSGVERAALAFGLSFALLPLIGIGIAASPFAFVEPAVVGTVTGFVLVGTAVAAIRRVRVPANNRYQFRLGHKLDAAYAAVFRTSSPVHTAINLLLVVCMLLALSSVGYALVAPQDGEQQTELQLLTENESDELVAADYETTVEPNESVPLTLGIENQEGTGVEYTAVIEEQWVDDGEILDRTEHQRTTQAVSDGETEYVDGTVTPDAESGTVRIAVLLYDGDVPETPTIENADRSTYLWTEIEEDVEPDTDDE